MMALDHYSYNGLHKSLNYDYLYVEHNTWKLQVAHCKPYLKRSGFYVGFTLPGSNPQLPRFAANVLNTTTSITLFTCYQLCNVHVLGNVSDDALFVIRI